MQKERLVDVYVTLVKANRRSLVENEEGVPVVPHTLIEEVRERIEEN